MARFRHALDVADANTHLVWGLPLDGQPCGLKNLHAQVRDRGTVLSLHGVPSGVHDVEELSRHEQLPGVLPLQLQRQCGVRNHQLRHLNARQLTNEVVAANDVVIVDLKIDLLRPAVHWKIHHDAFPILAPNRVQALFHHGGGPPRAAERYDDVGVGSSHPEQAHVCRNQTLRLLKRQAQHSDRVWIVQFGRIMTIFGVKVQRDAVRQHDDL
mmetsp:Transcript_95135/g.268789  ORF Transcript_95135/g.268789 Transcript_95135/m.268789 type:complete len:212 (+) Transcript_95135:604-1239(+)